MRFARFFSSVLVLAFALCFAGQMLAQGTSQVSGVVIDPLGAAVPDAQVSITNTGTNATRTAQTNEKGEYTFPSLPIGPYKLEVKREGFATYSQTGIVLQLDTNPSIPVTLKIGNISEEISVTANAAMVETQSTGVNQVINPQQVVDLPLNGRQATDLVALSGAAVNTNGAAGAINTLDYPNAVSYSVAGSQPNATNYYLDGAQHLDFRTNVGLPMPFPDALSEFNLGISAMPANLGAHPGGSVNAATRSGTNSWHGNVFDFIRNGALDATAHAYPTSTGAATSGARDTLVRNQYGGTIGGPIKHDKVFFFFGYQGTTQSSTTGAATATGIPTAAMRAGDFSAALAKGSGCSISGQTINSAYTTAPGSNVINPALLQTSSAKVASAINALMPTSGNVDACGNYVYTALPTQVQENQFVGRVDWARNEKDTIFARYFLSNYSQPSLYTQGNIFSSSGVGLADQIQTLALGDTYLVNSRIINTLRLSFTRTATVRNSNSQIPTLCQLGMNATCPVTGHLDITPPKNTPGFLGYDYENSYGVTEGFAYTKGKHQFNAGFTYLHIQMNGDGTFQMNPQPTFNGGYTGVTMADFVTGNVDGFGQGNGQLSRDAQNQPSAYVQDTWKLKPNFQVTGGLRWDPYVPQHNKYGQVAAFSLAGYQNSTVSKQFVNSPPGITYPGDTGFNGKSATNNYYQAFAPRVGFVWDTTGKGTQTLRAGYGFFYDTSVLWNTMHIVLNPPWGETLSFTPISVAAGGGLANPYAGANGPNPFPTPLNPPSNFAFPTNGAYVFENQTNKPTYVQQWNLAFQRQLTSNMLFSATYIGNKTTHVWLGNSQNSAQYLSQFGTTGPCTLPYGNGTYTFAVCNSPSGKNEKDTTGTVTNLNARRALTLIHPQYGPALSGGLTTAFALGNGSYNGLLVSLEKRMSHGFQVLTNYTWSHCMDDGEIGQDITASFMNPANPKANWGNCGFNRKGIFNLSVVGQTPTLHNRGANAIEHGWNGSAIFTANTGANYNLTDNYDYSLSGVGLDRPNIVGNPNVGGSVSGNPTCTAPAKVHTLQYWFNPCAFAPQALGTFGNERRNDQVGPANWNLNLALWRRFALPKQISLDFRVEAFNALNHTQIGNPAAANLYLTTGGSNPTYPSTSAGFINVSSPSYTPRILQLAVKANF